MTIGKTTSVVETIINNMHQLELDLVGGENPKVDVAATLLKKTNTETTAEDDTKDLPYIPIQLKLDLPLP
ncbi:hypothetical protein [Vibrio cyclitrophicus]|uniref:hypothetical protein n=1 Tax=Vibrio cyclitrophicus TaxID=47951 RepID=UPI00105647E3|nr:hypothetical protein [Vibrio cyclitrophicus]